MPTSTRHPLVLFALVLAMLVVALARPVVAQEPPGPVWSEWEWADAGTATIHPGVQTVVEGGQCTSNFIFVQLQTVEGVEYLTDVLLGFAGHCATETGNADECTDIAYPVGFPVDVQGATAQASVAYNASLTMIAAGEADRDTCFNNDFGLVRLDPADWANVNPSIPVFGGPTAVNTDGTAQGEEVFSWGNSGLRLGIEQTSPKQGFSLGTDAGGWNHNVYTVTPGIPGDSGSAYLDAEGNALGVVSTVETALFPGSNNVSDLNLALQYVVDNEPSLADVRLEPGTEPFNPDAFLPLPL